MSQKKRVRVIAPQVNTDHFANYIFEVGGPVGQGPMAPMQQTQDISQDLTEVLQMYAQAVGMNEEQLQQLYTQIMQMEPDQQAQAIAQMQQELNNTMAANPIAKNGGDIKSKKKLLYKKIGGANTNVTSSSLVDQRNQIVKDAIGANMARDLVNQVTEQKLSEANDMMGYASNMMAETPTYDYGGYTNAFNNQGMGYANVEDNPFYNAMTNIEDRVGDAWDRFSSAVGNMSFSPSGKIKVKRRGDIFRNNPAQVSTDVPSQRYGGMQSYENAGSVRDTVIRDQWGNEKKVSSQDSEYYISLKEQNPNIDLTQLSFPSENPNNQQSNSQPSGSGGINGWHGGFYFQNGVPVTSIYDIQKAQQQGQANQYDVASMFQPGSRNMMFQGNLMNLASNPELIKKFGTALSEFQPDNVFLKTAKGKAGPFGAKVVLKWDYDENGRPVQKEVVEGEEETATIGTSDRGNLMGRIRSKFDVMKYNRDQRRAGDDNSADVSSSNTSSGKSYGPYSSNTGQNIMNMMTKGQTGNYTDRMPISSGNEEGPIVVPNIPVIPGFEYGGMPKARAGKMVIKEKYTPDWGTVGQAISPTMDMVSSLLEQRDLNQMENRIYTPDAYVGSIPMGNMSMGTKGLATLTGKENRFGLTANYGDALYQNIPGYELSGQMPYQPMGKYGGMYQPGGSVTPSEFYNNALKEKQYFLDNPDMWKEDPEMQNPDGSFNLCLDCLNVDYNDQATVQDVVRLINEGHSQYPHHSADIFASALQKFGITPPTFGSAVQKKYGGSYQVGGSYELTDDEIDDIINRGGEIQYF